MNGAQHKLRIVYLPVRSGYCHNQLHQQMINDQAVAVTTYEDSSNSPSLLYIYTFIEAEYLIPPSNAHPTSTTRYYSHGNNFDLPASSSSHVTNENDNFQKSVEISVGRIAMMAAVVLIGEEVLTGASLPELIAELVV